MKDNLEIELNAFDCNDLLELVQEKKINNRKVEYLCGEVKRANRQIEKLLDLDEEYDKRIKVKRDQMQERYTLSKEYSWNLNLDDHKAVGVFKEDLDEDQIDEEDLGE